MKKLILPRPWKHLLSTLLLLSTSFVPLLAEDGYTLSYSYKSNDKTAVLESCTIAVEDSVDVIIPEKVEYNGETYTVTIIQTFAFSTGGRPEKRMNSYIRSVIIPNTVVSISSAAFKGCIGLKSVLIPNSVTRLGHFDTEGFGVFQGCTGLTSINIPNSVTYIGGSTFSGCTGLTSLEIPESVTRITYESFAYCSSLEYVSMPSVIDISEDQYTHDNALFKNCYNLKTVYLSDKLKRIPGSFFTGCTSLASITIPSACNWIGNNAFRGCSNVKQINVGAGNTKYDSRDNCNAIIETASNTLLLGCQNTIIPNSVTCIGSAFSNCTGLTSIDIPNSVTTIGQDAFRGCTGLTSVNIPNTVTSIGASAFHGCTGLKNISINNSDIISIDNCAFENCTGITSLNLTKARLGEKVFKNCTNLTSCVLNATSFGAYAFDGCIKLETFETNGSSIPNYAFNGCTSLTTFTNARNIGDYAFNGCSSLKTLTLIGGSSLTIGSYAFNGCSSLTEFPALTSDIRSVSIGDHAFNDCTGITAITFSPIQWRLENFCFSGCTNIKDIKVEYNYNSGFSYCGENPFIDTDWWKNHPDGEVFLKGYYQRNDTYYNMLYLGYKGEMPDNYALNVSGCTTAVKSIYNLPHLQLLSGIGNRHRFSDTAFIGTCDSLVTFVLGDDYNDFEHDIDPTTIGFDKIPGFKFVIEASSNGCVYTFGGGRYHYLWPNSSGFNPRPIGVYSEPSPTSIIIEFRPIDEEHHYGHDVAERFAVYGLNPNTNYDENWRYNPQNWTMADGQIVYYRYPRVTCSLKLETQPAEATSNNRARISAKTNGEDDALRFGFEWRRYDAPEEMPSSVVTAPVYEGEFAGTLNNLSANTYYKYRAMYTSDAGQKYYGDWVAFITADAYVYFEPEVHTFEATPTVPASVRLRGSAVGGSDDIVEQGFEYWPVGNEIKGRAAAATHQKVQATGMMMTATLEGLRPGTTYAYCAYVRTAKETTYGEELRFATADDPTAISDTVSDEEAQPIGYYSIHGKRLSRPERGITIVRYSDGTAKKIFVK